MNSSMSVWLKRIAKRLFRRCQIGAPFTSAQWISDMVPLGTPQAMLIMSGSSLGLRVQSIGGVWVPEMPVNATPDLKRPSHSPHMQLRQRTRGRPHAPSTDIYHSAPFPCMHIGPSR